MSDHSQQTDASTNHQGTDRTNSSDGPKSSDHINSDAHQARTERLDSAHTRAEQTDFRGGGGTFSGGGASGSWEDNSRSVDRSPQNRTNGEPKQKAEKEQVHQQEARSQDKNELQKPDHVQNKQDAKTDDKLSPKDNSGDRQNPKEQHEVRNSPEGRTEAKDSNKADDTKMDTGSFGEIRGQGERDLGGQQGEAGRGMQDLQTKERSNEQKDSERRDLDTGREQHMENGKSYDKTNNRVDSGRESHGDKQDDGKSHDKIDNRIDGGKEQPGDKKDNGKSRDKNDNRADGDKRDEGKPHDKADSHMDSSKESPSDKKDDGKSHDKTNNRVDGGKEPHDDKQEGDKSQHNKAGDTGNYNGVPTRDSPQPKDNAPKNLISELPNPVRDYAPKVPEYDKPHLGKLDFAKLAKAAWDGLKSGSAGLLGAGWKSISSSVREIIRGDNVNRAEAARIGYADTLARMTEKSITNPSNNFQELSPKVPQDMQDRFMNMGTSMDGYKQGFDRATQLIRNLDRNPSGYDSRDTLKSLDERYARDEPLGSKREAVREGILRDLRQADTRK